LKCEILLNTINRFESSVIYKGIFLYLPLAAIATDFLKIVAKSSYLQKNNMIINAFLLIFKHNQTIIIEADSIHVL